MDLESLVLICGIFAIASVGVVVIARHQTLRYLKKRGYSRGATSDSESLRRPRRRRVRWGGNDRIRIVTSVAEMEEGDEDGKDELSESRGAGDRKSAVEMMRLPSSNSEANGSYQVVVNPNAP